MSDRRETQGSPPAGVRLMSQAGRQPHGLSTDTQEARMQEQLPQPLLELQAVLCGAETTMRRIAVEIERAVEAARPCLPATDFEDDTTERTGADACALQVYGIADHVVESLKVNLLVALDRARRATPENPSPEPRQRAYHLSLVDFAFAGCGPTAQWRETA